MLNQHVAVYSHIKCRRTRCGRDCPAGGAVGNVIIVSSRGGSIDSCNVESDSPGGSRQAGRDRECKRLRAAVALRHRDIVDTESWTVVVQNRALALAVEDRRT